MAKQYVWRGWNKRCWRDVTYTFDQSCNDCMSVPPCVFLGLRIPCESCNINFRSQKCFDNHKKNTARGKTVFERKRNCASCGRELTSKKNECFKTFCANCKFNVDIAQLCYMQTLKNRSQRNDNVLLFFYYFETTQDTELSDSARLHVPNLVCVQQFCSRCEMMTNIDATSERCGMRRHSFWDDPVGDLLSYLCETRRWSEKVVAIAHNAKGFDSQFILNRLILMRWKNELIMNGLKIVTMKIEHMVFIDSASYLPMPMRKLPEAFFPSVAKSWYPHLFNTRANLDYVCPIPDTSFRSG